MDYGSFTPIDPRIQEELRYYSGEILGNPSAPHSGGRRARMVLTEARERAAALIGAEEEGRIIFTSGATEANNLAVVGTALGRRSKNAGRVLVSAVEHPSVIAAAESLAPWGYEIVTLPVGSDGIVDLDRLRLELEKGDPLLVSIQFANGEIGTVQPILEIGRLTRERGVPLHVDATVAAGKIKIRAGEDRFDLLTLSSNDLYGPQGMGALYVAPRIDIRAVLPGGGQQYRLRAGTENMAAIAGFGTACKIALLEQAEEARRLQVLRDKLIKGVEKRINGARLTGHRENRLPHHASFRFDGVDGESVVLNLDMNGVLASTGSPCSRMGSEPSRALSALGLKGEEARGSVVLTMGRWTKQEDVDRVLDALPAVIERLRRISSFSYSAGH
jgi:cysteine desulfurase